MVAITVFVPTVAAKMLRSPGAGETGVHTQASELLADDSS